MCIRDFIQRYKNARLAVKQIKAGEWVVAPFDGSKCFDAVRGDLTIWLASGAWFCEISGRRLWMHSEKPTPLYLGLFWRHYVWWAAARKLAATANKNAMPKAPVLV